MTSRYAKLALGLLLLGLAAGGFVPHRHGEGEGLQPGAPAPELRLSSLDGLAVDLASFRGRVVVLNLWATWCPPCLDELPSLEGAHRALGGQGLVVIGVATDSVAADVRRTVRSLGLTFPILDDPSGQVAASYRAIGVPETYVIDRAGRVVGIYRGPARFDTEAALAYFRALLAPPTVSG